MAAARILVDPELEPLLKRHGLLDLDAQFTRTDLVPVKALLEERQTLRLQTDGGTFYIKRYPEVRKPAVASLFARRFDSPASREWHVINRLHELGVPTMRGAACLEDGSRAALLTVGLDAPETLEALTLGPLKEDHSRRRRFAREVGRLLRVMHDGGVNHRDFYLVHLRVGRDDTVYVTDLNRADIRKRVTRRWKVKDLAALLHSTPLSAVRRTDLARCARAYFNGPLREHRSMIKAVQRKAARITAHTKRKAEQGDPNYHVVE